MLPPPINPLGNNPQGQGGGAPPPQPLQGNAAPQKPSTVANPFTTGPQPLPAPSNPGQAPKDLSQMPTAPTQQLALKLDQFHQAYYGEGFQGMARKVYSDLFGTQNFSGAPTTPQGQAAVQKNVNDVGQALQKINWDEWGKNIFGISSSDISKSAGAASADIFANRESAVGSGQEGPLTAAESLAPTLTGQAGRVFGFVVSGGLQLMAGLDWVSKRVVGAGEGLSTYNDPKYSTSTAINNTLSDPIRQVLLHVIPGLQGSMIFSDMFGKQDTSSTFQGFGSTLVHVPGNFANLAVSAFTGAVHAIGDIVSGKQTVSDVGARVNEFIQGSDAAYTMMNSAAALASYQDRYANNEPAGFIAQDIQNPMSELVGSLTDPAMYLGMGIPGPGKTILSDLVPFAGNEAMFGKMGVEFLQQASVPWKIVATIPTFGEILGIGSRSAQLAAEGDRFFSLSPEIKDAFKPLQNPATEDIAAKAYTQAAQDATKAVQGLYGQHSLSAVTYNGSATNITSLTADGKANVLARDFRAVMQGAIMGTRDTERFFTLANDAIAMAQGDVQAAGRLASDPNGKMLLSPAGLQSIEMLRQYQASGLLEKIVSTSAKDPAVLSELIAKTAGQVAHDMIPSVQEMAQATNDIQKGGSGLLPKILKSKSDVELASIIKGTDIQLRDAQLASKYVTLPWWERATSTAAHIYEKGIFNAISGGMGEVYINLNPAFMNKKVLTQGTNIALDMGLAEAGRIVPEAIASNYSPAIYDQILARNSQESKDILGVVHEAVTRGFHAGDPIGLKTKDIGFSSFLNRSEIATSGDVALGIIKQQAKNFLEHGAIPDPTAYGLPKDISTMITKSLVDNYGQSDKAVNIVRQYLGQEFIPAQHMLSLPPDLEKLLTNVHQEQAMKDIQLTATSQADFEQKARALLDSIEKAGYNGASNEPVALSRDIPKGMTETWYDLQKAEGEGALGKGASDQFGMMTQAYGNMNGELDAGTMRVGQQLHTDLTAAGLIPERQAMQDAIEKAQRGYMVAYQALDKVSSAVMSDNGLYQRSKDGEPIAKLWKEAVVDTGTKSGVWNLSKIYPNVDPASLTRDEFHSLLINSMKDFKAEGWRAVNSDKYNGILDALNGGAQAQGKPLESYVLPGDGQGSYFQKAAQLKQQAEDIHTSLFADQQARTALRNVTTDTTLAKAPDTLVKDKQAVFEAVNAARAAKGEQPYATLDSVPRSEWVAQAKEPQALQGPPPYSGINTYARGVYENTTDPKYLADKEAYIQAVKNAWGTQVPTGKLDPKLEQGLSDFKTEFDSRWNQTKPALSAIASRGRDMIMNDYNKTYLERAMAYVMPFSYFKTESYVRYAQRFADNPKLIIDYMAYRNYMSQIHAGLPNFYKYNIPISNLPGIDLQNPFYINLENAINPMKGLTETPFSDPYKRADWLSTTVDNLNQISGSSLMTPVNWAVALHLWQQGKEDAANRWTGQLFPQTTGIKAALTLGQQAIGNVAPGSPLSQPINNQVVKNNQIDPFVNFLGGNGLTPYERDQVGSALVQLTNQGLISKEQAMDAANSQSGPIWQQAAVLSSQNAAPGQMASFFLGVGFKARSPQDVQNNAMNTDIGHLMSLKTTLSPTDYQAAWKQLNTQYPGMDTILLSHKGGDLRDTAYAYNVLSRLPPGDMTKVLQSVNITPQELNQFYANKGDLSTLTPSDKARWTAAISDLGAMLKMPSDANQAEWNTTRLQYNQALQSASNAVGQPYVDKARGVWDTLDTYFNMRDNPDQNIAMQAQAFYDSHPELAQAQQIKDSMILNNPLLAKYYGSLSTIDSYYNGKERALLEAKFPGTSQKWATWSTLNQQDALHAEQGKPTSLAKTFLRANPDMREYLTYKATLDPMANQAIIQMAQKLPADTTAEIRPDFTAKGTNQTNLQAAVAPTPKSFADLTAKWSDSLKQIVVNYWAQGTPLPASSKTELTYLAKQQGLTYLELLRQVGVFVNSGQ